MTVFQLLEFTIPLVSIYPLSVDFYLFHWLNYKYWLTECSNLAIFYQYLKLILTHTF